MQGQTSRLLLVVLLNYYSVNQIMTQHVFFLTDWLCVCVFVTSVWLCECNHEAAASDPAARSLSGFSSFTSQQDIFGVAVSDTLIITGRLGCQWSARISILLLLLLLLFFSVMQVELSLCKRGVTDGCLASKCWWRSRQLRICQVAHLWADRGAGRVFTALSRTWSSAQVMWCSSHTVDWINYTTMQTAFPKTHFAMIY